MSDTVVPVTSFYYGEEFSQNNWYNTSIATAIAIEEHYAPILFKNDLTRIIYASTDYCFRERSRKNKVLLNLPFMNYYLKSIERDTSPRSLWNNANNIQGMLDMDDDHQALLNSRIRLVPVKLHFEASVWYDQPQDLLKAYQLLALDESNETIIYSYYDAANDCQLKVPCFVKYNLDYNPEYSEKEWLEENKIMSIAVDFEITTFFLYTHGTNTNVSFSNHIIFNFLSTKGIINTDDPLLTTPQELIIEYFNV